MKNVTAHEVMQAAQAAGITRVDHHTCSLCGHMVFYSVHEGQVYFHPNCNCGGEWRAGERRSWDDIAREINMQNDEWKVKLAERWGIRESAPTRGEAG